MSKLGNMNELSAIIEKLAEEKRLRKAEQIVEEELDNRDPIDHALVHLTETAKGK